MKNKVGFPKLCANETLLNEYYKDVSLVIISFYAAISSHCNTVDFNKISIPLHAYSFVLG